MEAAMEYQVFLNFRTEDTHGFTKNLYDALDQAGILPFMDEYHEPLASWRAIERSLIAIIVFSKDYASSSRCLVELLQIMKYHRTQAQVVIPIFYNVDPFNVQHQIGRYGEVVGQYERISTMSHPEWLRRDLTEAANFDGYDNATFGNDDELIARIVADVDHMLVD
ncbi:hypothetical protein QN277_023194 [Acacia crassicarpa]|uniref:ADP-ribosyl cyclase/cyclic ADP-ribose hydrolase n=1 Tax=Acacia crassicarpa TaxID=499986 RepID=A0AAE1MMR5_9FABA|nr:hypothetical protein QN277_023194 [Acacia crassicarpa]